MTTFCSKNDPKMFGNAPKRWISWKSADICLQNVKSSKIWSETVVLVYKRGFRLCKNASPRSEVARSSEELAWQRMTVRVVKINSFFDNLATTFFASRKTQKLTLLVYTAGPQLFNAPNHVSILFMVAEELAWENLTARWTKINQFSRWWIPANLAYTTPHFF